MQSINFSSKDRREKKNSFTYPTNFMNATKLLVCLRTDTWDWFDPVILVCMHLGGDAMMH